MGGGMASSHRTSADKFRRRSLASEAGCGEQVQVACRAPGLKPVLGSRVDARGLDEKARGGSPPATSVCASCGFGGTGSA